MTSPKDFSDQPPASTPATGGAPAALVRVHEHMSATLAKLNALTWTEHIPDMCCDDHYSFEYDELHEGAAHLITGELVCAFLELAERHEPLMGVPCTDNTLWWAMGDALNGALGRTTYAAADVDQDALLDWARTAPVSAEDLAAHFAHRSRTEGEFLSWVGVRCAPQDSQVRLLVSEDITEHVRPLNDAELTELTTLPA